MPEKMDFTYNITDLIAKKRDGDELSEEEIRHFVNSVTLKTSSESQIGAMLMAIFLKGMNREETVNLTKAMLESGTTLRWPEEWRGSTADKHSTGGVGDKVSLVLAPALAVCGVKVPMISGRSLGHTGGTLDKLESIPGFRVNLSAQEMHAVLAEVGCCIVGQTETLVPADRALYAIRDVTGTVASIPLISSSILSKKASGECNTSISGWPHLKCSAVGLGSNMAETICGIAHLLAFPADDWLLDISALILDVKCGKAAFTTTEEKAQALAYSLVNTCDGLGIKAAALITSMDTPLGRAVGNSVEVVESIHCLSGEGPEDLKELVCEEGGLLLHMLNKAECKESGKKLIADSLKNGKALEKFCEMIVKQGVSDGTAKILSTPGADYYSILPLASQNTELVARRSGIVSSIDALTFARVCHELGAGRHQTTDSVDHGVGLVLNVRIGQFVTKGHKWLTVYHHGNLTNAQSASLEGALIINESGDTKNLPVQSRVIDIIDSKRKKTVFVCQ